MCIRDRGTAAVVMLGDSLTGDTHPLQLVVSGALFAIGIGGLVLDARLPVSTPATASADDAANDKS